MPSYKREFQGKGKKLDKSPYFIILCSSALRAVEVIKYEFLIWPRPACEAN